VAAITAAAVLAYDHFDRVPTLAVALAMATLGLASFRHFTAVRENQSLLLTSREEALEDSLTGLGNHRLLLRDLEQAIAEARPEAPLAVQLLDLNGLKRYNDTYGHPASDQLLVRLASRLERAVAPQGTAYRLGGMSSAFSSAR